jgi:cytochrome c oxidase subunit II
LLVLLAVVSVIAMSGCGGGGSSSSSSSASPPPAQPAATTPSTSTGESSASVTTGKQLFTSKGCKSCHSISGTPGVGPALDGVAGSQVQLSDGSTVTADAAYLTKSIDDPNAQVVKGFNKGVMASTIRPGSVSASDTAALVAYIQSLK